MPCPSCGQSLCPCCFPPTLHEPCCALPCNSPLPGVEVRRDPYLGEVDPQGNEVIQFATSQSGERGAIDDRGLGGARPEHVADQNSGSQQGDMDVDVRTQEYVKLVTMWLAGCMTREAFRRNVRAIACDPVQEGALSRAIREQARVASRPLGSASGWGLPPRVSKIFFGGCGREKKKKETGAAGRLRVLWGTVGELYKGYYNLRIMYASHF